MVASALRKRISQQAEQSEFETDVLDGLHATPKHIPAKYFYDAIGSDLFERITEVPEYYPTRCEMSTLRRHSADIARLIPPGAALVEFGSGSSKKARIVLSAAPKLAAYVPVDIRGEMIEREAAERYGELARSMGAQGNLTAAAVFALLASAESRHLRRLRERAEGLVLPPLEADHTWPDGDAPETVALPAASERMTQQRALAMALAAERRARAFFEQAARVCGDEETRALALEMAAEEAEHAALIDGMIARLPRPVE